MRGDTRRVRTPSGPRVLFVKYGDVVAEAEGHGRSDSVTFDGMVSYLDEMLEVCGEGCSALIISLGTREASKVVGRHRLQVVDASRGRGLGARVVSLVRVRRRLKRLVRAWSPGLSVLVDVGYLAGPILQATRRSGGRLILAVPGQVGGGRLRDQLRALSVRRVTRSPATSLVLARGGYLRDELLLAGVPDTKIRSYYPRYDRSVVTGLREEIPRRNGEGFEVLYVGRLAPVKGVEDLIPLAERLTGVEGIRLRMVGEGPSKQLIEDGIARSEARDMLSLDGARGHSDVLRAMLAADALVMPSRFEGIAKTAMEAALAGLPVIAYGVGGIREWVQDGVNGYLVPAGDIDAMAERVRELYEDRVLHRRMCERALEVGERVLRASPTFAEAIRRVFNECGAYEG